jgi:hypothetical protein
MTALSGRVRRMEQASSNDCPVCADRPPIMLRGTEQTVEPCPACGRVPMVVRLIRDRDFYRNADRLPPEER